jgi:predicted  nucleic acid-binding Zn-ribbon protein
MSQFTELLAVQDLDTRLEQLRHQHASLPERQQVASATARVDQIEAALGEVQREREVIAKAQQQMEAEVARLEAKKAHASAQLYGGSVVAHKELEALEHEIATLSGLQNELEDRILEQMELAEPLDERITQMTPEGDSARAELIVAKDALAVALAAIEGEIAEVETQRATAAVHVPAPLLKTYDALRGRLGGVGAARLDGARCTGCHLEIPAGELTEVRRAPEDEVVYCPECGRILVR